MLSEEAKSMGKHLNGPDPAAIYRLQLRLHAEVLQKKQQKTFKANF